MPTGQIARIPLGKNYGFIKLDSDRKDYFFHESCYMGDWNLLVEDFQARNDIKVSFDIVASPKGTRAENVRRIENL
jgi:cold shock CspA family protein